MDEINVLLRDISSLTGMPPLVAEDNGSVLRLVNFDGEPVGVDFGAPTRERRIEFAKDQLNRIWLKAGLRQYGHPGL